MAMRMTVPEAATGSRDQPERSRCRCRVWLPPLYIFTPPKPNSLRHIRVTRAGRSSARRWTCSPTPRGEVERHGRKIRSGLSQPRVRRDQHQRCSGPRPTNSCCSTSPSCSPLPGWEPILGRLFPRGLMLLDFEEHRLHRRALSVAFKSGPMKSYLAELDRGIAVRVKQWKTQPGPMLVYPAMKQLTLDLAATSFLGADMVPRWTRSRALSSTWWRRPWRRIRQPLPVHADGAAASGPQANRRLFLRADSDPPREGRRRLVLATLPAPPMRTARCCRPRTSSTI